MAFSFTSLVTKTQYRSNVQLYVDLNSRDSNNNLPEVDRAAKLVRTYIIILRSTNFLESVVADSGVSMSPGALKGMIDMTQENNTEIFTISVMSHNKEETQKIAESIEKLSKGTIQRIIPNASAQRVDLDSAPRIISSTGTITRNSILGMAVGAFISSLIAVIIEMLDFRVKNEEDLENYYNIPLLGSVPIISGTET